MSTAKTSPRGQSGQDEPISEFDREVALLLRAENRDPFRLLGPHISEDGDWKRLVVRGFFPRASEAFVVIEGDTNPISARRVAPEGLFEATLPFSPELPISPTRYRWRVREADQPERDLHDTYAFPPLLSDFDLHLMGEGTHYQKYEKMGAHLAVVEGVTGTQFGVWAPNGSAAT